MSIRASLRFALLLALLLLAACGNKGPLVKPAAPPQDAPATTP
jgi:predicted small lipoprotein YifL